MSPIFDEHDSPLKKTVIILGWFLVAVIAIRILLVFITNVLPVLAGLAFWLGPAVWVFWHAQKNSVARPFLWAVLTLFTWVIGLVVYLLVQSGNGKKNVCPSCGLKVEKEYVVCPGCGADLSSLQPTCPYCGKPIQSHWKYCTACGRKLGVAGDLENGKE